MTETYPSSKNLERPNHGTEFHDGDQIDTVNKYRSENLISHSEFVRRRLKAEQEARETAETDSTPEVLSQREILARVNAIIPHFRREEVLSQDSSQELRPAA